jgi:catechol 2,3-dioxygenase-like lactoylglutathione lyase family enzyme
MITMQFAAIDHIALNVDDVDRSLAFYHEALGLDIERIDDFRAGKVGFPSVRVTSQTVIDLMPGGATVREGRQPLNHFALTLTSSDLDGLRERLLSHEVEIIEEARPRWGAQGNEPSMKVLDPDGNIVELKAPPA